MKLAQETRAAFNDLADMLGNLGVGESMDAYGRAAKVAASWINSDNERYIFEAVERDRR